MATIARPVTLVMQFTNYRGPNLLKSRQYGGIRSAGKPMIASSVCKLPDGGPSPRFAPMAFSSPGILYHRGKPDQAPSTACLPSSTFHGETMSKEQDLQQVLDTKIVAVVRAPSGELLADVAEALLAGGITVMEITFTVPAAHKIVEQVASRLGDRILLGAGTVLDPETARIALLSGAEFLVSPAVNLDVIAMAQRYDKLMMPGAWTPTEVLTAWQAGADIVKVFPSDVSGPRHLRALHGPLPQVRLMPTGGVNLDTAADFLKAGACALGIGSSLVTSRAVAEGNLKEIESLARQYVDIVKSET